MDSRPVGTQKVPGMWIGGRERGPLGEWVWDEVLAAAEYGSVTLPTCL